MSTVQKAVEAESEREMVITRLVKAPRRIVWQAFTSAEHLGRWWGPAGFRLPRQSPGSSGRSRATSRRRLPPTASTLR